MSQKVVKKLEKEFGDKILAKDDFRGDDEVTIALGSWVKAAEFLKSDPDCAMDHFGDLTAVDWPEREAEGGERFDLVLYLRSVEKKHRIFLRARVADGKKAPTLTPVYPGANWAEREVYDMFGIEFADHPDLRRILMYEEFEGFPLRKDYPIDKAQPLVEYRDVDDTLKLPPFGIEEGQPFGRIDWEGRLEGVGEQVSPSIGLQTGERRALSDSEVAEEQAAKLAEAGEAAEGAE
ncbi:MAG: NADH-quinone oxidoreductase subunit C [Deltaproteobacteria bacterium]|nr:NADH-quinone oxidoreductase subunit C [Deltaproteobacteria bacterium]